MTRLARIPCDLLMFAALFVSARPAFAETKIAVVDVHEAMDASPQWKTAIAALEKKRSEKQAALEAKQKELKARKDKLDAQKAVSEASAAAAAEEALYKDAQELTQGFMQSQQELSEREKKLTDQMLGRIEAIVRDLAQESGFDFVFERGTKETPNVLYAPKAVDLTKKVIEQYNKRFKTKPLE